MELGAFTASTTVNERLPVEGRQRALRVLHVVESLGQKAVETWLLRVLAAATEGQARVEWTVFCTVGREEALDAEYRRIGVQIIHSRYEVSDKLRFLWNLRRVLKQGQYDVIHCHHDVMSAAYLIAASGLSISRRIVHIHNTGMHLPTPSRLKRFLLLELMRHICLRGATDLVGISNDALASMLGGRLPLPWRDHVVYYAVDTGAYRAMRHEPAEFRKGLGLSENATLILFAGRMVPYKNPLFVVDVLAHLRRSVPAAVALFAGGGELESAVREYAASKGLEDKVRVLGWCNDLPAIMTASDLLVWPGQEVPKEGLGLGVVEAQAAGLPVLMSRSVPHDAIVVPSMVDVLPLSAGPQDWAERAMEILQRPRLSHDESLRRVEDSPFSMASGVRNILALYGLNT